MKIGVIIPTRGDRPVFLAHCLKLLKAQTVQPDIIEIIDYQPRSNETDITQRYREGYDRMRGRGLDILFLMEDDDWYSPDYIEIMLAAWNDHGRLDIFGTNYTIYYNIRIFGMLQMDHDTRSSAMSTMIKPDMDFTWPADHEPYTDMWIWEQAGLKGFTFKPDKHICLGIKHGVGKCGGKSHTDRLIRYSTGNGQLDENKDFLRSIVGDSFEFYSSYFEKYPL